MFTILRALDAENFTRNLKRKTNLVIWNNRFQLRHNRLVHTSTILQISSNRAAQTNPIFYTMHKMQVIYGLSIMATLQTSTIGQEIKKLNNPK
jgi:hypothetical protein